MSEFPNKNVGVYTTRVQHGRVFNASIYAHYLFVWQHKHPESRVHYMKMTRWTDRCYVYKAVLSCEECPPDKFYINFETSVKKHTVFFHVLKYWFCIMCPGVLHWWFFFLESPPVQISVLSYMCISNFNLWFLFCTFWSIPLMCHSHHERWDTILLMSQNYCQISNYWFRLLNGTQIYYSYKLFMKLSFYHPDSF